MAPNPDQQNTTENDKNLTFRPRIIGYENSNKFCPGDRVYWHEPGSRELQGPFLISEVPAPQVYTLCKEDETLWKEKVPENELRLKS